MYNSEKKKGLNRYVTFEKQTRKVNDRKIIAKSLLKLKSAFTREENKNQPTQNRVRSTYQIKSQGCAINIDISKSINTANAVTD